MTIFLLAVEKRSPEERQVVGWKGWVREWDNREGVVGWIISRSLIGKQNVNGEASGRRKLAFRFEVLRERMQMECLNDA